MKSIIKKYLSGESTAPEQNKLLDWLREHDNLAEFQQIKKDWKHEVRTEDIPSGYLSDWNKIQNKLFGQMQTEMQHTRRLLSYFRYAAVILILISISALVYTFSHPRPSDKLIYTTVAADFGQISKVVLPDSTVIWINSGSTITYNNQFSENNRNVELVGEAFFKVRKNKNLPMIVKSSGLQVKVLGTEFCVTAYPEEKNVQVVLEKGSIELTTPEISKFKQIMTPGELASFDKQKKQLTLSSVNTGLYTSWKDGIINIYNMPLREVVIRLEKRYNQKFMVDRAIRHLPYTFTIKNENLNTILSLMEKITPLDAIQHGNIIELKYNKYKKNQTEQNRAEKSLN